MAMISVRFSYLTGLKRRIFRNARLCGNWDQNGRFSQQISETPMSDIIGEDGCPGFAATVDFDESELGKTFQWGVRLDTPGATNLWGIPTEILDADKTDRMRFFRLGPAVSDQREDFHFTYARRLGARKVFSNGRSTNPGLRFAVWAPNAQNVEVVFGTTASGYIADDGHGIDPARPVLAMTRGANGIWETDVIPDFAAHEGLPYMYRITNAQGRIAFRTDIFSRNQIGRGSDNPHGHHFAGNPSTLDGTKSCSLVVSLDTVVRDFAPPPGVPPVRIPEEEFWAHEFTPGLPVPTRIEDMIIYELHVGALGLGNARAGNLADAIELLPHLSDLGVNAVELMPLAEFTGTIGWGYGDSHHFVIESSAGGRDQYKHFVRECHRRGIAVIQDVVYNHFDPDAERAEWAYDSDAPEQNIYYWYEGRPADYPAANGGYLDNGSTGFSPRFWEEIVRHVFVSSAAGFIEEFRVDGLRVDLTQAIHRDNVRHADGRSVGSANLFGAKMLREWSRTLMMIKPTAMLIAEDHSEWDKVTQLPEMGGLGFGSTWFAAFYHNLIGDSDMAGGRARLIKNAGFGNDGSLDFGQFAGVLYASKYNKVVYHESHDEAGNSGGSRRTLPCAVNGASLIGATRAFAEARARVAFGLSLFSAGTPMFFMAEEVGAQKRYTFNNFINNREDIAGERTGNGAKLFRFYQDTIRFTHRHPSVRVQNIDIIHVNDAGRVIAFRRSAGVDELLIVASLNNSPFLDGYVVQTEPSRLPDGNWREVFNSDAGLYGGNNRGNFGAEVPVTNGRIQVRLPANGFVVFQKA